MKKKNKGSMSIVTIFALGGVFGIFMSLSDLITTVIPFEREWGTYALLAVLLLMSVRIGLLLIRTNKFQHTKRDTDEAAFAQEKLAYQLVGVTSLFLIIGSPAVFFILLEWTASESLLSGPNAYALAVIFLLYFYGIFAQIKAVKFHNKYTPGAIINWKRTDGYKEYFKHLDEGMKFEQYRVAYQSFYAMNILFPAALFILLLISKVFTPQFVAIGIVGLLWFMMYMIYYREGYKTYKS